MEVHSDTPLVVATWALVGVTFVLAGGTLYFMRRQVEDAKRVAAVDLFMQVTAQWDTKEMRLERAEICYRGKQGFPPFRQNATAVIEYFESVGYLAKEGHLDIKMLFNELSVYTKYYWAMVSREAMQMRKDFNDETLYENAEWLVKELEKRDRGFKCPTSEELVQFCKSEQPTSVGSFPQG